MTLHSDLNHLRHALGAIDAVACRKWGLRNHFNAVNGGKRQEAFERLVADGLATRGRVKDGSTCYHATEKGCVAIGLWPKAIKRALAAIPAKEEADD